MPTFETPDPITAEIETGIGHLLIRATDRTDTVVDVEPSNRADDADVRAAEQTLVEYANGRLVVKTPNRKKSLRRWFSLPPAVDVTVDLPAGSIVDVDTWGEISSEGRLGEATVETAVGTVRLDETGRLKLRTAAGDVSVARAVGPANVNTSSGRIWIGEIDGPAVVKTSNGDVTLGEVGDDLRLSTANGNIVVNRARGGVDAKTAFGSIRVGEVARGSVVLKTSFGELDVGVRNGTAVWLDVASGFGNVRSDLEATPDPGPSEETVKVHAHTGYGDIVIRRSEPASDA